MSKTYSDEPTDWCEELFDKTLKDKERLHKFLSLTEFALKEFYIYHKAIKGVDNSQMPVKEIALVKKAIDLAKCGKVDISIAEECFFAVRSIKSLGERTIYGVNNLGIKLSPALVFAGHALGGSHPHLLRCALLSNEEFNNKLSKGRVK